MKRRAVNLIRSLPHYRKDAFDEALKKHGFEIINTPISDPRETDLLITWNRYGTGARQADLFEKVGAPVLIVENGYLPMKDTKKAFSISLNHHVGGGSWPAARYSRIDLLDIVLEPWRQGGKTILVLPQRGIGHRAVAMPTGWPEKVVRRLHPIAVRPIYVRKHPELLKEKDRVPLEHDLSKAWCAVTWASSAAIKAVVAGIPVFFEFPKWIAGPACIQGLSNINHTEPVELMGDREDMLANLAWAQWSVEEVFDGKVIGYYLERFQELRACGEL